jgi:hypothetical protein
MHACVIKWRVGVDSRAATWVLMVGLMTHFLQLASAARGLRGDICMVKGNPFSHFSELAEGVDNHV